MHTPQPPHEFNEPQVFGCCLFCGSDQEPQVHREEPDGSLRRLWCTSIADCDRRRLAANTYLDQRYELTPAGSALLDSLAPVIQRTDQAGVYTCDSQTVEGLVYTLTVVDGGPVCTCPGFSYRGACKHSRQLRRCLAGRAIVQGAA